jgi:serine/threonine protein kinase
MGESLQTFGVHFDDRVELLQQGRGSIPPPLLKCFAKQVLQALDYAHSEVGIIHTDVHPGNIMVQLYSESSLARYLAETEASVLPTEGQGSQ